MDQSVTPSSTPSAPTQNQAATQPSVSPKTESDLTQLLLAKSPAARDGVTVPLSLVLLLLILTAVVSGAMSYLAYPNLKALLGGPAATAPIQTPTGPMLRSQLKEDPAKPFCTDYGTFTLDNFTPQDPKYKVEGVTIYVKAQGNISYNTSQPMFGINAPNSGTGPFIIPEDMEATFKEIPQGSCVEVLYGSKGMSGQKVIFEIHKQEK
jgi:hypothetical protein